MAENTMSQQCTDSEFRMAREAGIFVATSADEVAIHKFAASILAEQKISDDVLKVAKDHRIGHLEQNIANLVVSNDALASSLKFMLAYETNDDGALEEIQEAFNQQEEIKEPQKFARCYCVGKMRAALAVAGVV